jgi:hypothetical protein
MLYGPYPLLMGNTKTRQPSELKPPKRCRPNLWHTFQRPHDMHPCNVSINHVTGKAPENVVTCQTSVIFLPAFFVVMCSVQTEQPIPSVDGPNDGACNHQC